MFDRPQSGERAILVHLDLKQDNASEDLNEFRDLATSAGAETVAVITGARRYPEAKYFVGSGKAEEIREQIDLAEADVVLVNHAMSPAQERNLEKLLSCRVLDRTGLILDIFAQRARSHEGKLQVELAQLRHLSTRLVRGWTHLERQKGGIGLRGPGETQLESDRRLIGDRIKQLKSRLKKVNQQREMGRRARRRAEVPTVSLVGYTNAGKSTLFNALTCEGVFAADQLFATLDPTLRRLTFSNGDHLVLADTVGFIRHLPHDLIEAFRSTLQETLDADLLLLVIDAADEERNEKRAEVVKVLNEIGAGEVPRIEVYNKIDNMETPTPRVERDSDGAVTRVYLSAATGDGLAQLVEVLGDYFQGAQRHLSLQLPSTAGKLRARLYEVSEVIDERYSDTGEWLLECEIKQQELNMLCRQKEFEPYLAECGLR